MRRFIRDTHGQSVLESAMLWGAILTLTVAQVAFVKGCGTALQKIQTREYNCWTPNEPGSVNTCRPD